MKIYVLTDSRDHESSIYRVFSSFEAAHKYLGEMSLTKKVRLRFYITEHEVYDS